MVNILSTYACGPCRASKVGCDKSRPQCMRCLRKGHSCNYTQQKAYRRPRNLTNRNLEETSKKGSESQSPLYSECIPAADARDSPVLRRRNRVPIACARCRRLKVKCDRQEPCSRCLKSDRARDCYYLTDSSSADAYSESKEVVPLYKQTYHSGIHWSGLVENIENLLKHRRWPSNHQHVEHESLFSPTNNFFGGNGSSFSTTRRTLLSYLPPRDVANSFIANYLDIIEPAHEILHVPTFRRELDAFGERPSTTDDAWLAQLFAVLALGCQLQQQSTSLGQRSNSTLPSLLFDAARGFLQRTPFMIRPDMRSIRTLCLLVIFRQTTGLVCLESSALWPVTGLIVRLAVTIGLHLTVPICGVCSSEPPGTAIKLWAAVILLDLRQSLTAGVPVIPPPGDLITEPLFGTDGTFGDNDHNEEQLPFPAIIYKTLPRIYKILELATSPQIALSYTLVAAYDRQIKAFLKNYRNRFVSKTNRFQWSMINVFFRRVLLALHSRLYQEPDASTRYPVSYWSSLECSLALLSEQRELYEPTTPAGAAVFFAGLHQHSFFLAALTVCYHLVQANSPLVSPDSGHRCQSQARRTILELLKSCRDIWVRVRRISVCHETAFNMVDSLLHILEGSENSGRLGSHAGIESCIYFGQWDGVCCIK